MTEQQNKGGEFLLKSTQALNVFTPEDLSDEQVSLGDVCRKFIEEDVYAQHDHDIEEQKDNITPKLLKKAGEMGLLMVEIPEALGGLGMNKATATVVSENSVRQGSFGVTCMCHTGIGTLPILYFGTEAQKQKYIPKLATGEFIGAYALTEAGSGSDALGAKTKAVLSPDGKHYILNGEKMWITNAAWADVFTVFAKIDGEKFTGFIVDKDTPGFTTAAEEKKMGIKGSSTRAINFSDAKVPVENVLGEIGKGHKIAFNILNIGRWKLGAACTGGCKWILREAIKYAKERQQFKQPIANFGLIRKKIADIGIRTYFTESMVYRIAGLYDAAIAKLPTDDPKHEEHVLACIEEFNIEASIAKVYGSEALWFAADEGVQTLGGYGFSAEYPMERVQRDSRINRIFEGTNEINRLLIPGTLLKRAMSGGIDLMGAISRIVAELKDGLAREGQGPLAQEIDIANFAKKLAVYASGVAVQKYMQNIQNEQLIMEAMANLTIEAFAIDSGVARALKLIAAHGEAKTSVVTAMVKTYASEKYAELLTTARTLLANVAAGNADEYAKYAKALSRFDVFTPLATNPLRETIAARLIEKEAYVLI